MKYKHFSVEEREVIQQGLRAHQSIRAIAKLLDRSPSSVARELKRNNPIRPWRYTSRLAHERALALLPAAEHVPAYVKISATFIATPSATAK